MQISYSIIYLLVIFALYTLLYEKKKKIIFFSFVANNFKNFKNLIKIYAHLHFFKFFVNMNNLVLNNWNEKFILCGSKYALCTHVRKQLFKQNFHRSCIYSILFILISIILLFVKIYGILVYFFIFMLFFFLLLFIIFKPYYNLVEKITFSVNWYFKI